MFMVNDQCQTNVSFAPVMSRLVADPTLLPPLLAKHLPLLTFLHPLTWFLRSTLAYFPFATPHSRFLIITTILSWLVWQRKNWKKDVQQFYKIFSLLADTKAYPNDKSLWLVLSFFLICSMPHLKTFDWFWAPIGIWIYKEVQFCLI